MKTYVFQKTATAVAYCKRGSGNIRVNGRPLDMIEPKMLQYKLQEPILLLGKVYLFIYFVVSFDKYLGQIMRTFK